MKSMDCKIVLISLCISLFSTVCDGHPLRKRTVSEVQLMHNWGEHKQVQERREWLQMRLKSIHLSPAWAIGDPEWARGENIRLRRRKLLPKGLPDLDTLSPEEIQFAMDYLEELMKSKKQ